MSFASALSTTSSWRWHTFLHCNEVYCLPFAWFCFYILLQSSVSLLLISLSLFLAYHPVAIDGNSFVFGSSDSFFLNKNSTNLLFLFDNFRFHCSWLVTRFLLGGHVSALVNTIICWTLLNIRSAKKRATSSRGSVGMDKGNKGLRHFSLKVCQKVKQKGITTYNEVRYTFLLLYPILFEAALVNHAVAHFVGR